MLVAQEQFWGINVDVGESCSIFPEDGCILGCYVLSSICSCCCFQGEHLKYQWLYPQLEWCNIWYCRRASTLSHVAHQIKYCTFTPLSFLFSKHSVFSTTDFSQFLMTVIKLWIVVSFVGCEVILALCCLRHHLAGRQASGFVLNIGICAWRFKASLAWIPLL